jgi:hypothetical protein
MMAIHRSTKHFPLVLVAANEIQTSVQFENSLSRSWEKVAEARVRGQETTDSALTGMTWLAIYSF